MTDVFFKWIRRGRVPSYQRGAPIPYRRWTERVPDPELCVRGWHACRRGDVLYHISENLWICELDGHIIEGADKVVAERLRLVRKLPIGDRELRLFAADCAERVLPIFEREHPDDSRPREAIETARRFAAGEATRLEMAAAGAAAEAAAWTAAWAAAWDAAWAAAWTAAGAAAWDAARAAAGDAERDWQTSRLLDHYGKLTETP